MFDEAPPPDHFKGLVPAVPQTLSSGKNRSGQHSVIFQANLDVELAGFLPASQVRDHADDPTHHKIFDEVFHRQLLAVEKDGEPRFLAVLQKAALNQIRQARDIVKAENRNIGRYRIIGYQRHQIVMSTAVRKTSILG